MKKKFNVVIPAAGAATRLRPLTNNCSKAMVRLHGKPAIAYICDHLIEQGAENIVIVDGKFDDIREYCAIHYKNFVSCVRQETLKGPRDAIAIGMRYLDEKTKNRDLGVVVWLGDTLVFDDLPLGDDFLLTKEVLDHSNWCIWDGQYHFYNKPIRNISRIGETALALVGVYSFSSSKIALQAFTSVNQYDISYALEYYQMKSGIHFANISVNEWHDIGTLASYQKTCAALLEKKSRAFNHFRYDSKLNAIEKISTLENHSELHWYRSLSPEQKMFTPRLLDSGDNRLILSYESGILLSDLFLYEDVTESTAVYLLNKVFDVMESYFWSDKANHILSSSLQNSCQQNMWLNKSFARLKACNSFFDQKTIDDLMFIAAHHIQTHNEPYAAIHGDLHLGNIIYDPYNDSIRFIDPRGSFGNDIQSYAKYGDVAYDLAKLSHDLYHGYGEMLHSNERKYPPFLRSVFCECIKNRTLYTLKEINDLGCLLLATCIPLHADSLARQRRFAQRVIEYLGEKNV